MIWLTWRQFRVQLVAALAAVATVVAVTAISGPRVARLATGVNIFDQLGKADLALFYAGVVLMAIAPPIIGTFWGAPLVSRELESGTHRLAWSQSVTRTRWLVTKLALITLAGCLVVGALSLAVTWWSAPLDGAVSSTHGGLPGHLTPITFAMRGIVPVGYTAFAVVLGVLLGAVLRRALPAMAVTLALYLAIQIAVPLWVRPHLVPPATATIQFSQATLDGVTLDPAGRTPAITVHTVDHDDWLLTEQTIDASGNPAALPGWLGSCLPSPTSTPSTASRTRADPVVDCLARLDAAGYRQRVEYQPIERFWSLQWAELAVFLAVSAVLWALSIGWVRSRLA